MNRLITPLIFAVSATAIVLLGAVVVDSLPQPRPELDIPEPDGEYRDNQGKCWRWNVIRSDNFVGISPKIWLCSDGRVLHDSSGVRLPVVEVEVEPNE